MALSIHPSLIDSVWAFHFRFDGVSRARMAKEMRDNKVVFLYLVSLYRDPVDAFDALHRMLEKGEDPESCLGEVRQRTFRVLRSFHGFTDSGYIQPDDSFDKSPIKPLPGWFKMELSAYLQDDLHKHPSKDFAFWLTAKLLLRPRFLNALQTARKRWRIHQYLRKPMRWYQEMNAFHQDAVDFAKSNGYRVSLAEGHLILSANDGFGSILDYSVRLGSGGEASFASGDGRAGQVIFERPFDFRNLESYKHPTRLSYGLPLVDYEMTLNTLTWLAGGMPGDVGWRCWTESFLWDFHHLPIGSDFGETSGTGWWAETNRNISIGTLGLQESRDRPGWSEPWGRMRWGPPIVKTLAIMPIRERPPMPGVTFLSRWIDVSKYPLDLRADLVYSLIEYWGEYEPLPGTSNMRAWLANRLRPLTTQGALSESEGAEDGDPEDWKATQKADSQAAAAARQRKRRLKS